MNSSSAILSVLQPMSLSNTPSLLMSNLTSDACGSACKDGSVSNDARGVFINIVYVHDNDVMCANLSTDSRDCISTKAVDIPKRSVIHTVSYMSCGPSVVLGIATDHGFQVWSREGTHMLWFKSIDEMIERTKKTLANEQGGRSASSSEANKNNENNRDFARGCASCTMDPYHSHICVGTSSGSVCIYSSEGEEMHCLTGSDNGGDMEINGKMVPMTALAASDSFLVSADEIGCLTVYSIQENYRQTAQIVTSRYVPEDSGGFYCTALTCQQSVAFAGFENGCIRVYRLDVGELLVEIAAHSRCVTGLALHPTLPYVASCGEDQTVNLWNIPNFSATPTLALVDLQCNLKLENSICTGVSWLKNGILMCASYDDDQVAVLEVVTRESVGDEQFRALVALTSTQSANEYHSLGSDSK